MLIQKQRLPLADILLFGFLPNFIKKLVYRLKGYKIGNNVIFGFGAVVCGEQVSIGNNSNIGFFTIVRGKNINIGSFVNIGSMTFMDTPHIEIGDGSKINEQVYIGGLQFPDSKIIIGKNCQIMQMSYINPAKSITIGDDSGIGGFCLIFGHTSWLSEFEGYPIEFKPIEIGNSVSLAWRVFILPGTKIGDGAVIGPNSLVNRTIPPRSLAVGYPARVISKSPDFPKEVSEEQKIYILKKIIPDMIEYFRGSGLEVSEKNAYFEITHVKKGFFRRKKKTWRLGIEYENISPTSTNISNMVLDVFVSLKNIPKEIRKTMNSKKVMWFDIDKKEHSMFWNDLGDEVALFLRRYGVRFFRVEE